MTKKQLEEIVWLWQQRLGLERWDLEVKWDEPPEDANAIVWRSDSYDRATVRFGKDWSKWSPVVAQRHVVHELLHLLTRDVDRVLESLDGQLHRDAYGLTAERYGHEIEGVIDRLSYRFVELAGS